MSVLERVVYSRPAGHLALGPVARWGYRQHQRTGATSRTAYRAMRKLYGNADAGLFEALAAEAAGEQALLDLDGEAPGVASGQVDRAVASLERDGFVVLDGRLDVAACDELEAAARAATCHLVGGAPGGPTAATWDEGAPLAVRYDVPEHDLVQSAAAQRLIADRSLLAVAQRYLGAAPIQDLAAMWWSAAPTGPPAAGAADAAAQAFHFDLDRLRFVKVFVLLTDVDDRTGPHVYVRGSHRSKSDALRHDGRMGDAEVEASYPGEVRRIGGDRGTVFLVDTIGLHKGQPLEHGHRLIFQTEYATSLFGAPYTEPEIDGATSELRDAVARYPWTFQRFRLR